MFVMTRSTFQSFFTLFRQHFIASDRRGLHCADNLSIDLFKRIGVKVQRNRQGGRMMKWECDDETNDKIHNALVFCTSVVSASMVEYFLCSV